MLVRQNIWRKLHIYIISDFFLEKLQRQDIGKHLTAAADFVLTELPQYVTECCVVYVPEIGHLIVVKAEEPQTENTELQELGFQFMVNS